MQNAQRRALHCFYVGEFDLTELKGLCHALGADRTQPRPKLAELARPVETLLP